MDSGLAKPSWAPCGAGRAQRDVLGHSRSRAYPGDLKSLIPSTELIHLYPTAKRGAAQQGMALLCPLTQG